MHGLTILERENNVLLGLSNPFGSQVFNKTGRLHFGPITDPADFHNIACIT